MYCWLILPSFAPRFSSSTATHISSLTHLYRLIRSSASLSHHHHHFDLSGSPVRLTADDVIVDASSSYTPSPLITSQITGSICLNSYVDSGNIYVSYSFCVFYIGLHMVSGFPSPFCHVYFSFCFYLSLYIVSEFFWTC